MDKQQTKPAELERLQEWARVGLALHIAGNAVITMRYPEVALAAALPSHQGAGDE
ncbi:hypothetical protein [Sphingopyxis witflariensis]|uniref:hypothetical protein n=1 Tax=Sphingopyxis witflariensis TaxID=173675 RepID=UPI00130370D0|nr:hypothetical protein [Sphingopyxis witflariensis]